MPLGHRGPEDAVESCSDEELVALVRRAKHAGRRLEKARNSPSRARAMRPNHRAGLESAIHKGKEAWRVLFGRYAHCVDDFARWRRLPTGAGRGGLKYDAVTVEEFRSEVYHRMAARWKAASWKKRRSRSGAAPSFANWFMVVLATIWADIHRERHKTLKKEVLGDVEARSSGASGETDGIPSPGTRIEVSGEPDQPESSPRYQRALASIPTDQRVVYKLTYLYDHDLTRAEIRFLAEARGVKEPAIMNAIRVAYDRHVAPRAMALERLRDRQAEIHGQIVQHRERLYSLEGELEAFQAHSDVKPSQRWQLRRKAIAMRQKIRQLEGQRDRLRTRLDKVVRLPSRVVARIVGISPANVDTRLTRARRVILHALWSLEGDEG